MDPPAAAHRLTAIGPPP
uniref:Uncharacterized protein n=1 Tax=Lysobacter sp. ATCC 53042 TaxID=324869 RepID=F8TUE8_9GAMM|nr:unknown [Lysobacter sp. ATCC 53042]